MTDDYGHPVGRVREIRSYASRGMTTRRIVIPDPLGPPHTLHDAVSRIRVVKPDPFGVLPNGRPVLDSGAESEIAELNRTRDSIALTLAIGQRLAAAEREGARARRALRVAKWALTACMLSGAASWLIR